LVAEKGRVRARSVPIRLATVGSSAFSTAQSSASWFSKIRFFMAQ